MVEEVPVPVEEVVEPEDVEPVEELEPVVLPEVDPGVVKGETVTVIGLEVVEMPLVSVATAVTV